MELKYRNEYWLDSIWQVDLYIDSPADLAIEING